MKKLTIILSMVIFMLPIFGEVKIQFEKETIDIGYVDEGQAVQISFKFENVGDELLIIKKINTSCGCLRKRLKKREFEPGEKGKIDIIFNSQGKLGS